MLKLLSKHKKIYRIIAIVLVLIWMFTVFYFSNQPSQISENQSDTIVQKLLEIFFNNTDIQNIDFIVRKLAHLFLYTIGGMLVFNLILTYHKSLKLTLCISSMTCIIYAISDEIHQYFIPGRSCQLIDVGIDSIGICIGICFMCFIVRKEWIKS